MAVMPLVGEELAGYRLRGVLGRGGMSVVYEAEFLRLGNTVALKVLAPELSSDDTFRTRFLLESRTAASLNHPNVIPIYDSGPHGDLLYISMRYVAGADLRSVLRTHQRLDPDQALLLVGQTGRALDVAHRAGLVHRDVKPANILVERGADDDPDHVYLADFGITKHALSKSGLTATGQFVGTLDYIAPEQIQDKAIDGRTDIYSLGCVLYECLTGRPPFQKDVDAAVIWAHVEEQPAPASSRCPDLPPALDDVLARALAKRPDDRFDTCRDFMIAAREALSAGAATGRRRESEPATVLDTAVVMTPPLTEATNGSSARSGARPRHDEAPGTAEERPPADQAPRTPEERPPADGGSSGTPPSRGDTAISRHGPQRRFVPWAVAGAALVALVVVVIIALGGSSHRSKQAAAASGTAAHSSASMSSSATTDEAASKTASGGPIMQAVTVANETPPAGYIPPSTCKPKSTTEVLCTSPHAGATEVKLKTLPSLKALYTAYEARYRQLAGPFKQNYNDCNANSTNGEVSWNHSHQHSRDYTVAQLESGTLNDNLAVGRVFCTIVNGDQVYLVWTENAGRLLGEVYGDPQEATWAWWRNVHHEISIGPNGMKGMK